MCRARMSVLRLYAPRKVFYIGNQTFFEKVCGIEFVLVSFYSLLSFRNYLFT